MSFNAAQVKQLLAPINARRVLKDGKNNSHIAAHDVLAHLNRVFGFGNFSIEVMSTVLVHESCRNPDANYREQRWDVVYRAQVRVSIFEQDDSAGRVGICFYENVSCGDAQNQVLHDAHDLALKSAVSLATKRACISLGDQFGLSLYNKGQMTAIVKGTLVLPDGYEDEAPKDVQEGVEQTVALGTDETVHNDHLATEGSDEVTPEQKEMLEHSLGATEVKTEEATA